MCYNGCRKIRKELITRKFLIIVLMEQQVS
nr:hypothetical protein YSBCXYJI_YSBCXYJI_CDS_0095 [Caudoviricetes sp.]